MDMTYGVGGVGDVVVVVGGGGGGGGVGVLVVICVFFEGGRNRKAAHSGPFTHLKHAAVDGKDGDIKGAAAQVKHQDVLLLALLVQAIGDGGCVGLVGRGRDDGEWAPAGGPNGQVLGRARREGGTNRGPGWGRTRGGLVDDAHHVQACDGARILQWLAGNRGGVSGMGSASPPRALSSPPKNNKVMQRKTGIKGRAPWWPGAARR